MVCDWANPRRLDRCELLSSLPAAAPRHPECGPRTGKALATAGYRQARAPRRTETQRRRNRENIVFERSQRRKGNFRPLSYYCRSVPCQLLLISRERALLAPSDIPITATTANLCGSCDFCSLSLPLPPVENPPSFSVEAGLRRRSRQCDPSKAQGRSRPGNE